MPLDRQPNPLDGLRNMVLRGPTPFTNSILFLTVLLLVLSFAARNSVAPIVLSFSVESQSVLSHPWSLVLYPLVPLDPLSLLFAGSAFWLFGGSLERSWGTGRYILLFVVYTVITSLSVLLGDFVLKQDMPLATLLLPLAGIIVAFCALNPGDSISWWFVPIPTKWVMIIVFGLVWFYMGSSHPLLGLFAEAGPLAALWYVRNGRTWSASGYGARSRADVIDFQAARRRKSNPVYLDGSIRRSPLDIAGRWRDMQERKRLERLLRNSGLTDPDERRDERR